MRAKMERHTEYKDGTSVVNTREKDIQAFCKTLDCPPLHIFCLDSLVEIWKKAEAFQDIIKQEIIHVININRIDSRCYRLGNTESTKQTFKKILDEIEGRK